MTNERTLLPVEKLTVKVSTIVEKIITIDQSSDEWSWLQEYPQDTWQEHLEASANETDGQLDVAIEDVPADVAYRDVKIIGPHTFLHPKSDQPDPWGLS
jgi:hypothetical protein